MSDVWTSMVFDMADETIRRPPGSVRDAVLSLLRSRPDGATVGEIRKAVEQLIGAVPASSVRSSLNLQAKAGILERTQYGHYRLRK